MTGHLTQGTAKLAGMIDHTLLKPNLSHKQLMQLCAEASEHGFCSVCVPPNQVKQAAQLLTESSVKVCTVIGFPLGYSTTETKAFEAQNALQNGADEIDMVIDNVAVAAGNFVAVEKDVAAVVEAANGKLVKVILETCLLTPDQIQKACIACKSAGAHFVKTSTGFSTGGATVEAVKLMRETVGSNMGVKASGGIRNLDQAEAMVSAGANRLGCSSGVQIVSGQTAEGDY